MNYINKEAFEKQFKVISIDELPPSLRYLPHKNKQALRSEFKSIQSELRVDTLYNVSDYD